MNNEQRKDPIVIDDSLIGRELFFRGKPSNDYTIPNARYKVSEIKDSGCLIIQHKEGATLWIMLNSYCAHLQRNGWLLAKRTSSSQSVVRTESGRKL